MGVGGKARWRERKALSITGHSYHTVMSGGMMTPPRKLKRRQTLTIAGANPEAKERAAGRETFSVEDARAAMGIDWMPMKYLSQAIPPAYGRWIGERAVEALTGSRRPG